MHFGPVADIQYHTIFPQEKFRCHLIIFFAKIHLLLLPFEIWEVEPINQIHLLLELYDQYSSWGQAAGGTT